jgi:outer membrane protein TolC
MVAASALSLASCAVGPNFKRPAPPPAAASGYAPAPLSITTASAPGIANGNAEQFVMGRDIPFAWWTQFGSSKLDTLVDKALAANPTLPAAQAALRQAQEQVARSAASSIRPSHPAFSPAASKWQATSAAIRPVYRAMARPYRPTNPDGPAPYNGPVVYNFYTAQVALSYTPTCSAATAARWSR